MRSEEEIRKELLRIANINILSINDEVYDTLSKSEGAYRALKWVLEEE